MKCRNCSNPLSHNFADLGFSPPSNAYLSAEKLFSSEKHYPLVVKVCDKCLLVQTEDFVNEKELFDTEYAYFSSTTESFLRHAKDYFDRVTGKLSLNSDSFVVEIASNDGYLLKNFLAAGIPCLGVEPTNSTAEAARALGITVVEKFFSLETALDLAQESKADLIVANNVFAHVPDLVSFTKGLDALLKDDGSITIEVSHVLNLLKFKQFDSIYHEHFSYYSLASISDVFRRNGLKVYDVEEIPTHGGSLRVYACKTSSNMPVAEDRLRSILDKEKSAGLYDISTYSSFQNSADVIKNDFLAFLLKAKREGKKVAGYGAAAKGNTLINYAGVKPDLLPYICDLAPSKQGKFTPGAHIPICDLDRLYDDKPDFVVIFPWNIANEIMKANEAVAAWGARFVTFVPEVTYLS